MAVTVRQLLVLGGALAEVGASWWVVTRGIGDFQKPAPGGQPPVIPAGYAFSIWTPIFAGMLGYALYQLRAEVTGRALLARTGWGAAIATWGAAAWVLVAADDARVQWTVPILLLIVLALGAAHRGITEEPITGRADRLLVRAPLGLFFGWSSVALFANLAAALRERGVTRPGAETMPSLLMLAGAVIAAVAITRSLPRNGWYAGAVVWALVAIAVANVWGMERAPDPAVAAAAGGGALLVLGALFTTQRATARPPIIGRVRSTGA